jgi:hypothetical protein
MEDKRVKENQKRQGSQTEVYHLKKLNIKEKENE